jgi:hypothetical protein
LTLPFVLSYAISFSLQNMLLTDAESEGGAMQLMSQSSEVSQLLNSMREAVTGSSGSGSGSGDYSAEYGELGPNLPYGSQGDGGDLLRLDSLGSIK